jgi:ankyrin repeat protein
VLQLSLSDFSLRSLQASPKREQYITKRTLLGYAACFWANHFRNSDWENSGRIVKKALSYFNPKSPASLAWFEIYQTLATEARPRSFTPLVIACYFGLSVVVQRLLEAGADANVKANDGRTPLHWASVDGHDAVVQRLLEAGADVNAKTNNGWTPLYRASADGHDAVVQRLLEAGADVNAKTNYGLTPLYRASANGHDAVVQRLLEAGADANVKENDGWTTAT